MKPTLSKFDYANDLDAQPAFGQTKLAERGLTLRYVIIGAAKCGTSSLHSYLSQHPQVDAPITKELNFFSTKFENGLDWYCNQFPVVLPNHRFTGEASPSYFNGVKLAHERLHTLFPEVKLIALLRNPIDRAYSEYHQVVRRGLETRTFEEAMRQEIEILQRFDNPVAAKTQYWGPQKGYIGNGCYVYQLQKWLSRFSRQQLLVVQSERFYAEVREVMGEVLRFLDLAEHQLEQYPAVNTGTYPPICLDLRQTLSTFFQPHNHRLEAFLEQSFDWN